MPARHRPTPRHGRAPRLVRPALGLRRGAPGGGVDPRRAGGAGRAGAGRGGAGGRLDGDPARRCCRPPGCWRRSAGGGWRRSGCWRRRASSTTSPAGRRSSAACSSTARPTTSSGRPATRTRAETLVFVAHHDAAQGGLIYRPELTRLVADTFPGVVREADDLAADAAPRRRRAGAARRSPRRCASSAWCVSAGSLLAFGDIATRTVVPGANDNLTAVAVLLELARLLRERPVEGVRVLLVSTGSEESFMEGMRGWVRRHGPALDRDADPRHRARDARLAGADPARGRGDDLDDRLRPRGARLHRRGGAATPAPRCGAACKLGFATDALSALRARAAGPPRSPPATSTRCRPTTTRSATSRATSTSRRWRRARGSPRRRSGEQRAREADRVLAGADLARVLRLLELGHAAGRSAARARPSSRASSSPRTSGSGGSSWRRASAGPSISRASSRWAAIAGSAFFPRVARRSATVKTVTSAA